MALVGKRDGRNFGYGRQLSYAGPQALLDLFGGGHYGTVKAHSDRWQAFVKWCRSTDGPGYNDARQIDRSTLHSYATHLRQQIQQGLPINLSRIVKPWSILRPTPTYKRLPAITVRLDRTVMPAAKQIAQRLRPGIAQLSAIAKIAPITFTDQCHDQTPLKANP